MGFANSAITRRPWKKLQAGRDEARKIRGIAKLPRVLSVCPAMQIDLRPIIEEIARQADDFLAGATDRAQARAGIAEMLTLDYADLLPDERKKVTDGVMAVLEHEDFFGTEFVGGAFDDDEGEDE
jgi:hypothetical protein